MSFEDIIWKWPWALLALPLPIIAYQFLPRHKPRGERALLVPDLLPFESFLAGSSRARRGLLSAVLLILMWLALVTATARPQSFGDSSGLPVSGRDLMLCLDISGSMREQDIYSGNRPATRMAVVKIVARDFIARRGGDRLGLIMFGTKAYVQSPLTYDHETVLHFLDEAQVGLAGGSTAIGDAIGLGVKRLRERDSTSRVLILLTDGANSDGAADPIAAARLAADNNIRVYTIGVGSDSGGSLFGFGMTRNQPDEKTLQQIAEITSARYFRARDQRELENIYREIDRLEPTETDESGFRPMRELYVWPLAAALVLSVLWALQHVYLQRVQRA